MAELEVCANDQLRVSKSMASGLTCNSSLDSCRDVEEPESCKALQAGCPGLNVL